MIRQRCRAAVSHHAGAVSGRCDDTQRARAPLWTVKATLMAAETEFRARCRSMPRFHRSLQPGRFGASGRINRRQAAEPCCKALSEQRPKDADAHQELADRVCVVGRMNGRSGAVAGRRSPCRRQIPTCTRSCRKRWPARGNWSRRLRSERQHLIYEKRADDWNDLGVLEARAGKITEASEDLEHALRLVQDHAQGATICNILSELEFSCVDCRWALLRKRKWRGRILSGWPRSRF